MEGLFCNNTASMPAARKRASSVREWVTTFFIGVQRKLLDLRAANGSVQVVVQDGCDQAG
jgi:hypothetical protein